MAELKEQAIGNLQPMAFVIEAAADLCCLRLCVLLQPGQYRDLSQRNYTPPLRSRLCLTAGLDSDPLHAWVAARLAHDCGISDMLKALKVMGRELEASLSK